jgi:hypothetical protein
MSYLKNQTLASAPALFVLCRYLAHHPTGARVDRLRKALAPAAIIETGRAGRTAQVPPVLLHSLAVGVDIELLDVEGARDQRVWTLRNQYVKRLRAMPAADSRAFRSLLLRQLGTRALQSVERGEAPPDVPFGLIWLLTLDPLRTMSEAWDQGPSKAFEQAGMRSAVDNPEQWRPFLRWARALGVVNLTATAGKPQVSVDPTRAIEDALADLPRRASTPEWLDQLYGVLPLLGDQRLVNALPAGRSTAVRPSGGVALALSKLEHSGRVRLVPADDAANAVVLRLGSRVRRVARIEVTEETT